MSRRVVLWHNQSRGGRVEVDSSDLGGARFTVTLRPSAGGPS